MGASPTIFSLTFLKYFLIGLLASYVSNPVAKLEVDPNPVLALAQFPSPFSKNAFLYILGNQTDWGPHTNGKFESFFDRLGF